MTPARAETLEVEGARVHILWSRRADGDFHLDPARTEPDGLLALDGRRRALVDAAWTQPDEVHGRDVLVVEHPGQHDLAVADAVVTRVDHAVIGIWTGDCAPVALVGDDGTIAGVHAGWRGAAGGVLGATIEQMRAFGAGRIRAVLGPCIHACCYEFGDDDLRALVERFGPAVSGVDRRGRGALDMPALVAAVLRADGVELDDRSVCTGCHADDYFSHRVRAERSRQIMAVWRTAA